MASDKDDTTIDLSKLNDDDSLQDDFSEDDSLTEISDENEEFKIHHLETEEAPSVRLHEGPGAFSGIEAVGPGGGAADVSSGPASKVKVKFDKFITLVATHTYEDILRKNADEDVIISTNLLTDLANAHDDSGDSSKKLPMLFVVGIVIGVLVTWVLLKT